jgi:hypothetical protein
MKAGTSAREGAALAARARGWCATAPPRNQSQKTRRKASTYWSTYLILRFNTIPDSVDVDVMDWPGQPFLAAVGAQSF